MKRGIEMSWACNYRDQFVLRIKKKRGKLTLSEIEDLIRFESRQQFCGHYAILLNCSEATIGGNGLYLDEDQKGDSVDLYQIEQEGSCPICDGEVPPYEYCPNCGVKWKDMDLDAEKLLAQKRAEVEVSIRSTSPQVDRDSKVAQYWSYMGALNMVCQMGFISKERKLELSKDAEQLKESIGNIV